MFGITDLFFNQTALQNVFGEALVDFECAREKAFDTIDGIDLAAAEFQVFTDYETPFTYSPHRSFISPEDELFSPPTADDLDGIFGGSTGSITHLGSAVSAEYIFSDISIGYVDSLLRPEFKVSARLGENVNTPVFLDISTIVLWVRANGKGFCLFGDLLISEMFAILLAQQTGRPAADFVGLNVGQIVMFANK